MIEHLNIINALHSQIASVLDLMRGSNRDVDIESINITADMCQTMLDELMIEIEKIEADWRTDQKASENIKTSMCDDYCRYTHGEAVDCIENTCAGCPLN